MLSSARHALRPAGIGTSTVAGQVAGLRRASPSTSLDERTQAYSVVAGVYHGQWPCVNGFCTLSAIPKVSGRTVYDRRCAVHEREHILHCSL